MTHHWAQPSALDRVDAHRASAEWVAGCWVADDAKLLKFTEQGGFTTNAEGTKLRMTKPFVAFDAERHYLLGLVEGHPIFVVRAVVEGPTHNLRAVGDDLNAIELDIAATATALCQWHNAEPHCSVCGNETTVRHGGFQRVCTNCGREHFPRTDPAVIVAIRDPDDRLLLARRTDWPETRRSVLAGFVEAGESLEQAVHREMAEEADVELTDVRYLASQPWPLPRSLMVAFSARTADVDFSIDGDELVAAEWYTRDELRTAVARGSVSLPIEASIAYGMIQRWLADDL